MFALVFRGVDGDLWIEHLLTALPGGQVGFLIFVNLFVFVLAFFLDFFEIAFIVIPLLAPVAHKLGIDLDLVRRAARREHADLVHAPAVRLRAVLPARHRAARGQEARDIYWGAVPWVALQLIMVALVITVPQLVTMFFDAGPVIDMEKAGEDVRRQIERALQPQ